jgi:hypothetical protein
MKRTVTIVAIVGLLGVGMWSCGGDDTSTGPSATTADYAAWGTIMTIEVGFGKPTMTSAGVQSSVSVSVRKNDGTEDVSNWPYQEATEVKLIGAREITLMEMAFGDMAVYMLPEEQTIAPGETYKLRMTVEGRTFTSKNAARVLDPLTITTSEGQVEPGASFTVQWNPVQHTAGYVVQVTSTTVDRTFLVGTATQKELPGDLFGENGTYHISVTAYEETMASYLDQWVSQTQDGTDIPSVYGFDDPKVLGMLFSMAGDEMSVQVGVGGEDGGNGDNGGPVGQLEITVSAGLTPTISWTGGKAVALTVQTTTGAVWILMATDPQVGFASPVTYGQVPPGAEEMIAAAPLVAGTTYQVIIGGVQGSGTTSFTP